MNNTVNVSVADKRKEVQLLLGDPEWSQWSDREIAQRCQVWNTLVSSMRQGASVRNEQIARRVKRGGTVYEIMHFFNSRPIINVVRSIKEMG